MRYSLTIREAERAALDAAVFSRPGCEGAAYLLCGRSTTGDEERLLCRDVVPVDDQHCLVREPLRLSIASPSYASIAKRASAAGDSVVFVHCHPDGIAEFSPQDDREEPKLMEFLASRLPAGVVGSVVVTNEPTMTGRIWAGGAFVPMDLIRVVGQRFTFFGVGVTGAIPQFFDRQVLAFGRELQRLLSRIHVGVVGAGGTGSPVIEQLARLGVGTLSIFDGDAFDLSNASRVYASRQEDAGVNKARLAARNVEGMGLGTKLNVYDRHITEREIACNLRACDVVFGCTDKQTPRSIMTAVAVRYLIPLIDVGVKVSADQGRAREVTGRVTTFLPGEACLFCRRRINSATIALEALSPNDRRALVDENYADDIDLPNPAVITFTTAVAAQAVTEFLHRLTGFMGEDRATSEVLLVLHETALRRNRRAADPQCGVCQKRAAWGAGDRGVNFLGQGWAA